MGRDSEIAELGRFMKERRREIRADNLSKFQNDGSWTMHTEYHYSKMVKNKKLDYWPSSRKFQYEGRVHHESRGRTVTDFINNRS